jgi:nickel transport protein
MQKLRLPLLWFFLFPFSLLWPGQALAHSMAVWAEVDGPIVRVEATWSDGSPVKNARVVVSTVDRKGIVTGRTDEKGKFSFTPPEQKDLTVKIVAGGSHEGTAKVSAEDLRVAAPSGKPSR